MIRLLALLLFVVTAIPAKTVFVSPNGDNTNPGTASQPRKTIEYGLKLISAGDTMEIKGGTCRFEINTR